MSRVFYHDWNDQSKENEALFVKLNRGSVTHSIIVTPDMHWKLYVHGKEIKADCCTLLKETSTTIQKKSDITNILGIVSHANVCA